MRICVYIAIIFSLVSCNSRKKKATTAISNPVLVKTPIAMEPTIVFGKYCGHCRGICATMYKVGASAQDVTVDRSSNLTQKGKDSLQFNELLNQQDCDIAQQIREIIPAEFNNVTDSTFGCPDCADQCGYFLQIIDMGTGKAKTFYIDTQTAALPSWLKLFPIQVSNILNQLNKEKAED